MIDLNFFSIGTFNVLVMPKVFLILICEVSIIYFIFLSCHSHRQIYLDSAGLAPHLPKKMKLLTHQRQSKFSNSVEKCGNDTFETESTCFTKYPLSSNRP